MMRILAIAFLSSAAILGSDIEANADVIDAGIGNTITIMMDGVETRFYFNENGSVSLANADGGSDVGTWSRESGELCIAWETMNGGEPQCAALSQENPAVGDTFSLASPDGGSQDATLRQGKVPF